MKKFTILALSGLMLAGTATAALPQFARKAMRTAPGKPLTETMARELQRTKGAQRQSDPRLFKARPAAARLAAPKARRAPLRIGATGSSLYGWLSYTDLDGGKEGLYEIELNGNYTGPIASEDNCASCSWVRDGKLYATFVSEFWGYIMGNSLTTYDLATGAELETVNISMDSMETVYSQMAYDSDADMLYGYGYTADGEGYQFVSCSPTDLSTPTAIVAVDAVPASMTYDAINGQLVGMFGNQLMKIDPATGGTSLLATAPVTPAYKGGICYSPIDGGYLWDADYNDADDVEHSVLYKITVPDYAFTKVADYANLELFSTIVCADTKAIAATAPGSFTITRIQPNNGELNATGLFTAPTLNFGGSEIPAGTMIEYTVSIDGAVNATGQVAPGSMLPINFTDLTEGNHRFSIFGAIDGAAGPEVSVVEYIGNDTPLAPANVTLGETSITWDAVTAGVNGGYVQADAVTYDVTVNGQSVATGVTGTSCPFTFASDALASYRASVVANCNGKASAPGLSSPYLHGDAMELPVDFAPSEDEFPLFTVVDANSDGKTFVFNVKDDTLASALYYSYSSENAADDWAFLPPLNFPDADAVYSFAADMAGSSSYFKERFEVCIGTAADPAAMTTKLIEPTVIASAEFANYSKDFAVPAAGVYYIGIHAISDADMFGLYAKNIQVAKTDISPAAPEAATGLKATAAPKGELKANVEMTLPVKSITGADLTGTLTANLVCGDATASVTGAPGAVVNADIATAQGDNTIYVTVSNAAGDAGLQASVGVFTGIDVPGIVENLQMTVSEDDMTIHMTWEAPSEVGENGGYCPSTGITYALAQPGTYGWEVGDEIGTDVYEYDIVLPEGADLELYQYGITAKNAQSQGYSVLSATQCVAGTPWPMPWEEQITAQGYAYGPIVIRGDESYTAQWGLSDPNADSYNGAYTREGTEMAICGKTGLGADGSVAPGPGLITLTKIATAGTDKAQFYGAFCLDGASNVQVLGQTFGQSEPVVIAEVPAGSGWQDVKALLPASLQNRPWVELFLRAEFTNEGDILFLADYGVGYDFGYNLKVASVSGPAAPKVGDTAEYTATVENMGKEAVNMPAGVWTVRNTQGEAVFTLPYEPGAEAEAILPGQTADVKASIPVSIDFSAYFSVSYEITSADENEADNSASFYGTLDTDGAVAITDLKAVMAENGESVDLSWTEPNLGSKTESFEAETPGASYTPETLGDFKVVDGDDAECYTSQGGGGFNPNGGKHSFAVYDYNAMGGQAPDGKNVIVVVTPQPASQNAAAPQADDWLISPQVKGGSAISFSAAPITVQYGAEELQVMVSSTTDEPDAFTLLEKVTLDQAAWNRYEFTLPADAKYFALHYACTDIFGLCVDAITYVPASATDVTVTGYDIERDGDAIAQGAPATGAYNDAFAYVEGQKYAYNITPLLSDGTRGGRSNTAYLVATGLNTLKAATGIYGGNGTIHVDGFAGQNVEIYDASGARLRSLQSGGQTAVRVPAGLYMVRAGKTSAKVVVK